MGDADKVHLNTVLAHLQDHGQWMTLSYDFGVAPPCGDGNYGGSWYGGNVPICSGSHFVEP
ncbi:hypothetical protein ACQEV4_34235 [Streptomyces shenzhenensis]|uniref:hypothetical protein n=1 Tax=Streptomyces shenzhenensis TaxID=943815 RepID=UPI003D8C90BB